ncbi:MAG: FHA domain-containing protein [Burkholderiaceae bacterium]
MFFDRLSVVANLHAGPRVFLYAPGFLMELSEPTASSAGANVAQTLILLPMSSQGRTGAQEFRFDSGRTLIGRRGHTDLVLQDKTVSGEHAAITREESTFFIEDLGSSNGTLVNGNAITRVALSHDDIIELGIYRLKVCLPGAVPAADLVLSATLEYISGSMRGIRQRLDKPLTKVSADGYTAAISRRKSGFYVSYIDGGNKPSINGEALGPRAQQLTNGDEIELGTCRMRFVQT